MDQGARPNSSLARRTRRRQGGLRVTPKPLRAAGVSLRKALADDLTARPRDFRATSCTNDFRQVRPGDVFVALAGAESDGHDFAAEAVRRGAAAVVCERMLPVFDVPQFVVANSRVAYGKLCQALVGNPSQQLKVIGVTGTSGKTTVVRLLASIFNIAGHEAGAIDSLAYWDGLDCQQSPDAELSPPRARPLARPDVRQRTHARHRRSLEPRSRFSPRSPASSSTAVCITHVGRDHLDWHGSLENYRQAKRRILDHLRPDGVAILNADCQPSMRMLAELNGPALTIGLQPAGRDHAPRSSSSTSTNRRSCSPPATIRSASAPTIVGDHHVYNCLTAAALCLVLRHRAHDDRPRPRSRRRASRPDAARRLRPGVFRARRRRQHAGHAASLPQGGPQRHDRPADLRLRRPWRHAPEQLPALGRVAGSLADVSVVTTTGPRERGSRDFTRNIVGGFADPNKAHVILDRAQAIAWGLDQASEGDTVVLAGMGDRLIRTPTQRRSAWDDGDVAATFSPARFAATLPHRIAA